MEGQRFGQRPQKFSRARVDPVHVLHDQDDRPELARPPALPPAASLALPLAPPLTVRRLALPYSTTSPKSVALKSADAPLMFRTVKRLDYSRPSLHEASEAAFAGLAGSIAVSRRPR